MDKKFIMDREFLRVFLLLAIILLASHIIWAWKPSLYTISISVALFIPVLTWLIRKFSGLSRLGASLMLIGAISNSVVVFSNGGFMPVLKEVASEGHISIDNSTRFVWLSDIIFGLTSVGDLIIWSGALLIIIGSIHLHLKIKKYA